MTMANGKEQLSKRVGHTSNYQYNQPHQSEYPSDSRRHGVVDVVDGSDSPNNGDDVERLRICQQRRRRRLDRSIKVERLFFPAFRRLSLANVFCDADGRLVDKTDRRLGKSRRRLLH